MSSLDAVKWYLFKTFIEAAYDRGAYDDGSAKPRNWSVDDVKDWLTYLARHPKESQGNSKSTKIGRIAARVLNQVSEWIAYLVPFAKNFPSDTENQEDTKTEKVRNLAWWELRDAVPRRLSGLAVGIVSGLATGFTAGFGEGIGSGIGMGLGVGLILGLVVRFLIRKGSEAKPKESERNNESAADHGAKQSSKWSAYVIRAPKPVQGLVGGLSGGLLGGFIAGLVSLDVIGHGRGLAGGLPIGLGVGMGIGPASGFLGGLVGGLVGGFGGGLIGTLGTWVGLAAGLVNGLGVGLTAGCSVNLIGRGEPARGVSWKEGSIIGLVGGIAVGGTLGVIAWLVAGPTIGIAAGLITCSVAAYAIGLSDTSANDLETADPRKVLARDRRTFLRFGIAVAIATGPTGGLIAGLASVPEKKAKPSLAFLLANGWGITLTTSLVLGLSFAFAKSSWGSFTLARCWLALQNRLPWHLMEFLADAHKRGVLRQAGAVYQFRHLDLQLYLADPTKTDEAEQGERPSEPPVAGPAQASGDVGVAGSADHGDGEVA